MTAILFGNRHYQPFEVRWGVTVWGKKPVEALFICPIEKNGGRLKIFPPSESCLASMATAYTLAVKMKGLMEVSIAESERNTNSGPIRILVPPHYNWFLLPNHTRLSEDGHKSISRTEKSISFPLSFPKIKSRIRNAELASFIGIILEFALYSNEININL